MKKISAVILGVCLSVLLCLSVSAAFAKNLSYTEGQFSDVDSSAWYASEVRNTYSLGLMNGVSENKFDPSGKVTLAQAITMSARVASLYYNEVIPEKSGEWYQQYVDYALSKGIIKSGEFDDYSRFAKRFETALLFKRALPEDYFTKKNDVKAIPDVSEKTEYFSELLLLYNAGIVMGSDTYGSFKPYDSITRAEASAIINRVALPENRLVRNLDKISNDDAYALCLTPGMTSTSAMSPINSGWLLNNLGGIPRTDKGGNYGALIDINKEAETAYIREFNKITTGKITLKTTLNAEGDGAYIEYQNDAGESIYRVQLIDGDWKILGDDGKYLLIYPTADGEKSFDFTVLIDIDNTVGTTYINDKPCGEYPLNKKGAMNILKFLFGTTKESNAILAPGSTYMSVNYIVKNDFSSLGGKSSDDFILGEGAQIAGQTLCLSKDGTASRFFGTSSGTLAADFMLRLPVGESVKYTLSDGEKKIAVFESDKDNFYVNGEKVYENYYSNIWYRIRLELDTLNQKVIVKLNGRRLTELPFKEESASVDTITVNNASETNAYFDGFTLYRIVEHEDYVPKPQIPEGTDEYTVGMNVCSIWENGAGTGGWSAISPYDDIKPVLGYYDEGLSETADWEIKYTLEHGIDFQAFCIYFNSTKGVQRLSANHLFNGFMNAKYSDMAKYCVIWETANAASPENLETWEKDFIPYFIENFFKDPRYMTVDNRPIVCIFGAEKVAGRLGGNENAKKALDMLEEEAKKIGFNGVVYLACGSSSQSFADMGIDGCYAYNWGNSGYKLDTNINNIKGSASNGKVYTVPTVSVGFNNIGWAGTRFPLMSLEDYAEAHKWVKNEYLTTYPKEEWQKNFTMISTWNEYGEGTYIMPCEGLHGFGYLDVIRNTYTSAAQDASINTIPTASQRERINHLYPQYRHILRKKGVYNEKPSDNALSSKMIINGMEFSLNFAPEKNAEGDVLVAFDPGVSLDFKLHTFYLWDKDSGALTLNFVSHKVVYKVGSNKYTLDGVEKSLSENISQVDGLPIIPLNRLCADVGFEFSVNSDNKIVINTDEKEYLDKTHANDPANWEFDVMGDNGGWSSTQMSLLARNGSLLCESLDQGSDPRIFSGRINIPAEKYTELEMRVKYDYTASYAMKLQMFFLTDKDSTWAEDKALNMQLNGYSSNGEWVIIKKTLSECPKWKDTITKFRLDPFNAHGTLEIDYIHFKVDENYVAPEPEPDDGSFIKNGNAESKSGGFSSSDNLEIIDDPDKSGNKIYRVLPKSDGKVYLYCRQGVNYTPGKTYKVEMDMKLASSGTSMDIPNDFKAEILCNAQYYEPNGKDHLVARKTFTAGDGWVHWSFTFKVNEESNNRDYDVFSFYTNPQNDKGVGYFLDNIVVTEQ